MTSPASDNPACLLAPLEGRRPAAPSWFSAALAKAPERIEVPVQGAAIEVLLWGEAGKPGLLLLHGNQAHADWWSFIAPFFAAEYRVAAMSWSGMGGSGWRQNYSMDCFVAEIDAVAEAAGLFASACAPVVVAHSFGSFPALAYAAEHGRKLRGLVSIDSPVLSPEQREAMGRRRRVGENLQPHRVYPSLAAALARFRFLPAQPCENLYIVDHIARTSLKAMPWDHPQAGGWTWRFDPFLWRDLKMPDPTRHMAAVQCPVAIIRGGDSALFDDAVLACMREVVPRGTPIFDIPAAHHHVMVDQPLALVSALRGLLCGWPHGPSSAAFPGPAAAGAAHAAGCHATAQ